MRLPRIEALDLRTEEGRERGEWDFPTVPLAASDPDVFVSFHLGGFLSARIAAASRGGSGWWLDPRLGPYSS